MYSIRLAGPEISVATTKAYSTQLIAMYLLAIQFGKGERMRLTRKDMQELIDRDCRPSGQDQKDPGG